MVAIPRQKVAVKPYCTNSPISDNRVRCIQKGLGCSTQWPGSNSRCLVSGGEEPPHQLPGVAGSISNPSGLWEELDCHNSPLPSRQCDSSDLHQSEGRHHFCSATSVSTHYVDLVCLQKYHAQCGAPSRSPQHNSRSQISVKLGLLRLDAEPEGISDNKRENGAPGSGPLCFLPELATATILHLESRSVSSSDGRLQAGLVTTLGLCQSTLVPDPPVSLQSKKPSQHK